MQECSGNKILYVDLSTKQLSEADISSEMRKNYIGGAGINAKILYENVTPEIEPLSPGNILIFGAGVLVGTGFMSGARLTVTSKSPLTGIFADSNVGGHFAPKMRAIGYDHMVIKGKSEKPVYLFLSKGEPVQILDATELWGLDTRETNEILREKHGNCQNACIGPAGENLVKFACIIVSKTHAAGRTGMGCVMGSKNLKAVVVKSKSHVSVADSQRFDQFKKQYIEQIKNANILKNVSKNGSLFLVDFYNSTGRLLNYNGQQMTSEHAKKLYVDVFNTSLQSGKTACYSCPVACTKKYEVKEGKFKGEKGEKIDYGTVVYLGPNLGIYDYPSILHLDRLACNLGLDTMETGAVIGMAMECFQRGIIKNDNTNGILLKWGNVELVEQLIHDTAHKRGIGTVLAEGVKRAGTILGGERYAFNIKGLACSPQAATHKDWALGYITSTRGGDHLKNFPFSTMFGQASKQFARKLFKSKFAIKPDESLNTGRVVWWHENYKATVDSLGLCIFAISGLSIMGHPLYDDLAELMSCAAGIDMTGKDLMVAAERIYQLERAFNVKHGMSRKDDALPTRLPEDDLDKRLVRKNTVDCDHPGMLEEYYHYRGYSTDGFPTLKRLREVGLENLIGELADCVSDCDVPSIPQLLEKIDINI